MINIYLVHKQKVEDELGVLYDQLIDAGVATAGDIKNRIGYLEKQLISINSKIAQEANKDAELKKSKTTDLTRVSEQDCVRIIRLFLASSSEMKIEREQFEIFILRENKRLIRKNVFLELILWEDFIDTVSQHGLQKEYNKAINECEILVSLFFTKVGIYTEEEFDVAYNQYKVKGKPLIYTYFKNSITDVSNSASGNDSLIKFKSKLRNIGHYITTFESISDLKYQFKMQLDKVLPLLTT